LQYLLLLLHTQDVRKTFKYRLYPTTKQHALLDEQLAEACRLYNCALQERRDAWKMQRCAITYYQQSKQLRDIRSCGNLQLANFSSCQEVLRRVDKTFQAFFRRVKQDQKAGYPRFKSGPGFTATPSLRMATGVSSEGINGFTSKDSGN
jgi:putative transposase